MSIQSEDPTPVMHPVLGDLRLWHQAFEAYAATADPGDGHFHGPHIGAPVELSRVVEGLKWLEDQDPAQLKALPTLDELRALTAARGGTVPGVGPAHEGSPCHNLWHWFQGS